MKTNYFTLILATLMSFMLLNAQAEDVNVSGYIFSEIDSTIVPDYEVYLYDYSGIELVTVTNEDGYFSFSYTAQATDDSVTILIETIDPCTGDFQRIFLYEYGTFEVEFIVCIDFEEDCQAFFDHYQEEDLWIQFWDYSEGNPIAWHWNFGDGTSSTEQYPAHQYEEEGEYSVTLQINSEDCQSEIEMDVFVWDWNDTIWDPECWADFYYEQVYSDSAIVVEFADYSFGEPTSWEWEFGDGNTSNEQNPTHIYDDAGEYIVSLTIANDSCSSTSSYYIWVRESSACWADFYFYEINSAYTFQFIDYSWADPDTWAWDFGDGNTSNEQEPIHTYTEPGIYTVNLTIESENCSDSQSYSIYVGEWNDTTINFCQADFYYENIPGSNSLKFFDMSWGDPQQWYWDFGDGNTSDEQEPIHTYAEEGEYWVTLMIIGDSCESMIEMPVWAYNMDTAWIPESCYALFYPEYNPENLNEIYFYDASWGENITSWYWEFGDGFTSTFQNPVHEYAEEGWYEVSLEIVSDSCTNIIAMELFVGDDWYEDDYICQALFMPEIDNKTVYFHNLTNCDNVDWNWNFGDNNSSEVRDPVHVYEQKGTYTATLTIESEFDGIAYSSSFSMEINLEDGTIKATTGIKDLKPNKLAEFEAFKVYPNPVVDHLNVSFDAEKAANCEIQITNISGQLVYKTGKQVYPGNNRITINTVDYNAGTYFIRVISEEYSSVSRFIK